MRADDRELLRLAVPALGALIAEPLYLLTDTAIVGRLGTESLAGLSVASAILLTGFSVFLFLAYGTTAAVSRLLGAGEQRDAAAQAVQGLWLAGVVGVILAGAGWVSGPALIRLLGADGTVATEAWTYLRISLVGLPALLVSLAGVGYLRGSRDTRTPLLIAGVTAVGNGVLEWVLIVRFGRGIGASALATVLAQYVAGSVYVVKVVGAAHGLGADLRFVPARVVRLLVVGLHLLVRTAALRGSLLVGVAVATRLGTTEVAAYEVAFQVWTLTALALDALAIAAQSLVGHALGAGDADGARRVGRSALRLSLWAGVAFAAILLAGRMPVAALFSNDGSVVALTGFSLLFVAAMQPLNGLVFALDGILIGAGDERFLARAMAVAFAAYAPCAIAVGVTAAGLGWLWGALALFMAIRWVVLQRRFDGGRWLVTGAVR